MPTPLLLLAALCLPSAGLAGEAGPVSEMREPEIASELARIHATNPLLPRRIEAVSRLFLGVPYRLGPLGEGEAGEFDRDPLISFKEADCTTLVEEVMALSLTPDLKGAERTLRMIRYEGGHVSYQTRNHFPEADWVPNNEAAGFLRDITKEYAGDKVRTARKLISKRAWYAKRSLQDLQGFEGEPAAAREERLLRLRKLGKGYQDAEVSLPYVPIELLPEVIDKLPSGIVANLVREDQPDKPVLISHQVLIVDKDGVRVVRHAASSGQVEDVLALAYFYRYFNSKWPLLGLNFQIIGPATP